MTWRSLNDRYNHVILASPPLLNNDAKYSFVAYYEWHCYDTRYKNDFLDYLTNNIGTITGSNQAFVDSHGVPLSLVPGQTAKTLALICHSHPLP